MTSAGGVGMGVGAGAGVGVGPLPSPSPPPSVSSTSLIVQPITPHNSTYSQRVPGPVSSYSPMNSTSMGMNMSPLNANLNLSINPNLHHLHTPSNANMNINMNMNLMMADEHVSHRAVVSRLWGSKQQQQLSQASASSASASSATSSSSASSTLPASSPSASSSALVTHTPTPRSRLSMRTTSGWSKGGSVCFNVEDVLYVGLDGIKAYTGVVDHLSVSVKLLSRSLYRSDQAYRRMLKDVEVLLSLPSSVCCTRYVDYVPEATVKSQNLLSLFGAEGSSLGLPCVMVALAEPLPGEVSLKEYMSTRASEADKHDQMTPPQQEQHQQHRLLMLSWCQQLLLAVATLHERGLAHGDITPERIFVSVDGQRIRLGDVSRSRYMSAFAASSATAMTCAASPSSSTALPSPSPSLSAVDEELKESEQLLRELHSQLHLHSDSEGDGDSGHGEFELRGRAEVNVNVDAHNGQKPQASPTSPSNERHGNNGDSQERRGDDDDNTGNQAEAEAERLVLSESLVQQQQMDALAVSALIYYLFTDGRMMFNLPDLAPPNLDRLLAIIRCSSMPHSGVDSISHSNNSNSNNNSCNNDKQPHQHQLDASGMSPVVLHLIRSMSTCHLEQRMKPAQALHHPLFWNPLVRLTFVCTSGLFVWNHGCSSSRQFGSDSSREESKFREGSFSGRDLKSSFPADIAALLDVDIFGQVAKIQAITQSEVSADAEVLRSFIRDLDSLGPRVNAQDWASQIPLTVVQHVVFSLIPPSKRDLFLAPSPLPSPSASSSGYSASLASMMDAAGLEPNSMLSITLFTLGVARVLLLTPAELGLSPSAWCAVHMAFTLPHTNCCLLHRKQGHKEPSTSPLSTFDEDHSDGDADAEGDVDAEADVSPSASPSASDSKSGLEVKAVGEAMSRFFGSRFPGYIISLYDCVLRLQKTHPLFAPFFSSSLTLSSSTSALPLPFSLPRLTIPSSLASPSLASDSPLSSRSFHARSLSPGALSSSSSSSSSSLSPSMAAQSASTSASASLHSSLSQLLRCPISSSSSSAAAASTRHPLHDPVSMPCCGLTLCRGCLTHLSPVSNDEDQFENENENEDQTKPARKCACGRVWMDEEMQSLAQTVGSQALQQILKLLL